MLSNMLKYMYKAKHATVYCVYIIIHIMKLQVVLITAILPHNPKILKSCRRVFCLLLT